MAKSPPRIPPDVDVALQYTGLRPGEKLYEELWAESEHPVPTENPGIQRTANSRSLPANLQVQVDEMLAAARDQNGSFNWNTLLELVDDFQGHTGEQAMLPPNSP